MSFLNKVVEITFIDELAQKMVDIDGVSAIAMIESMFISDLPGDVEVYAAIRFAEVVDDHFAGEGGGGGNGTANKKLVFDSSVYIPRRHILMIREARELWNMKKEGLDDAPGRSGGCQVEPRIFPE